MMQKLTSEGLVCKAKFIRKDVIDVCVGNGAGHIAPSLSCVDILVSLYYRVLNISADPYWEERDRLILSKAHGSYGLYAILSDIGYIPKKEWKMFYKDDSLSGCVERNLAYGIEAGCGSLGHGLPQAVGMAFGAKLQGKKYRVYCIVGDGEMQEGSNWEAAQMAAKHELNNLVVIIDKNGMQAMDLIENILDPKGEKDILKRKMEAFGFLTQACNGHAIDQIVDVLETWQGNQGSLQRPQVLIADTIKGYGLKCMENVSKFHFRLPTPEEIKQGNRYE